MQKAARIVCRQLSYLQDADDSVQLADFGHTLDEILLHGHIQIPPNANCVGCGRRIVGRPFTNIRFAGLLADNSTHLADGLHTADQVLHSHCCYLQI